MNAFKTWIWVLCFASLFLVTADLTNAQNQWQYQENKHYRVLPLADTLKIENEQVEVLEIFAYSCNHCFNFESHLDQYDKAKPSYVNLPECLLFIVMLIKFMQGLLCSRVFGKTGIHSQGSI
jgi:hypothetical protein